MSSSSEYCFPTQNSIARDFNAQKNRDYLLFARRGMNDESFAFLKNLIICEGKPRRLNISHNCLTNKSLPRIRELYEKGHKIEAHHNFFQEKPEFDSILKSVANFHVSKKQPAIVSREFIAYVKDGSSRELVQQLNSSHNETEKKMRELIEEGRETEKKLGKLIEENRVTSQLVHSLTQSKKRKTIRFDKIPSHIEGDIARTICNRFSDFRKVENNELGDCELKDYEIDVLLLNEKGTILIIGEVRHDVNPKAFVQLEMRLSAFETMKKFEILPPILSKVKKVVGVIGGDFINDKMRQLAKKQGYIIVSKQTEYIIENEDLFEKYISDETP